MIGTNNTYCTQRFFLMNSLESNTPKGHSEFEGVFIAIKNGTCKPDQNILPNVNGFPIILSVVAPAGMLPAGSSKGRLPAGLSM